MTNPTTPPEWLIEEINYLVEARYAATNTILLATLIHNRFLKEQELLYRIPLTRGLYAIVDAEDWENVIAQGRWSATSDFTKRQTRGVYAYKKTDSRTIGLLLHQFIMPAPKGMVIDHINHDSLDNRKANLRIVTPLQNAYNKGIQWNNVSGYIGVSLHKRDKVWQARIRHDGKQISLGTFPSPEAAAVCYNEHALELRGEFANLNAIPEWYTDQITNAWNAPSEPKEAE